MRWKAPESAGYIEQLFGDLQRGPGASVLSASSGEQFSYESDKYKGGIFTYELLRCMQTGEADVARDGEFHVSELLQCVARHVLDDTQGQQRPTARGRDPYDQSIAREEDLVRSYPSLSSASHEIPLAAQSAGPRQPGPIRARSRCTMQTKHVKLRLSRALAIQVCF